MLVLHPESFPPWAQRLVGFVWLAGLAAPVGFWWRRGLVSATAFIMLPLAVTLGPLLTRLGPARWPHVAAVLLGVGVGWVTHRLAAPPRG